MSESTSPSSSQTISSSTGPSRYKAQGADNGIYVQLAEKIQNLGKLTLGGADYSTDFVCRITEKGSHKYVDAQDEEDLTADYHVILFGQTMPTTLGTQLSLRGNNVNYNVNISLLTYLSV